MINVDSVAVDCAAYRRGLMHGALAGLLVIMALPWGLQAQPAFACPLATPRVAETGIRSGLVFANDPALELLLLETLGGAAQHYGVVVKDLLRDSGAAVHPEAVFYAASLFKLPIMLEAFRQRELGLISFQDEVIATYSDIIEDLGTFPGDVGDVFTVEELLEMMITKSDNTSAIMLHRVLGPSAIDESMTSLGLKETSVMTEDLPTTAQDMALLLESVEKGQVFGLGPSGEMMDLLLRQTWRNRIPAGLPNGVPVGNKTGDWYDAAHDVAIVFLPSGPYVVAILSDGLGSDEVIVTLSRRIYEYYDACERVRRVPRI